jgi:alanine racemase
MTRPARACINLSALRHNLNVARSAAPGSRVLAVIKANGYGHGALRVAGTLDDADAFAVARLDEAEVLRDGGVQKPVTVLSGFSDAVDVERAASLGVDLVVHQEFQMAALEAARTGTPLGVWLKVDTGMHRLGFDPAEVPDLLRRLLACPSVRSPVRLMTHLASADDRHDQATGVQIRRFRELHIPDTVETSMANSAALLAWPESHGHWVRPGIMLYGISPFIGGHGADEGLRPAMTLRSRLIAVKRVAGGESIGYGGAWTCPEDMPVGVAAIGYGDGYPRHAPAGTPVLLNDARVPLIGRVSMDMITLDLRTQPDARAGDPVVLWGSGLPAEEVAEHVGTIAYELVCRLTGRVQMVEEE